MSEFKSMKFRVENPECTLEDLLPEKSNEEKREELQKAIEVFEKHGLVKCTPDGDDDLNTYAILSGDYVDKWVDKDQILDRVLPCETENQKKARVIREQMEKHAEDSAKVQAELAEKLKELEEEL